jgi:hypothetical protein
MALRPALPLGAGSGGGLADRALGWLHLLGAFFSAQVGIQALGLATGFLLVNVMSVRDFALYTLGSSVLGFFTFLSDLGSSSSLLHFYRRCAAEGRSFGDYYSAVLGLRRGAFGVGALVVLVGFPLVAWRQGFAGAESLLTAGAVICAVWFQIDASLRLLALRLDGSYTASYRAELAGNGVRLALALVSIQIMSGWLGMIIAAAGVAVTARLAVGTLPTATVRGEDRRREILVYLAPTLPSALYFSIQGPLVVWLAATFGSTRSIAEVGALGRLGLVFGIFNALTGTLLLPRLASILDDVAYRRRYLVYLAGLVALGGSLLGLVAAAPGALLALLGPHYSGLRTELLVLLSGSILQLLGGYAVGVNNARSWTRLQGGAVLLLVAAQALLASVLPLSSTFGVLLFGLGTAAVGLLLQLATTAIGFLRPTWVHWG